MENLGESCIRVIFVGLTLLRLKNVFKRLVHNQRSLFILGDFLKERFILLIYWPTKVVARGLHGMVNMFFYLFQSVCSESTQYGYFCFGVLDNVGSCSGDCDFSTHQDQLVSPLGNHEPSCKCQVSVLKEPASNKVWLSTF